MAKTLGQYIEFAKTKDNRWRKVEFLRNPPEEILEAQRARIEAFNRLKGIK